MYDVFKCADRFLNGLITIQLIKFSEHVKIQGENKLKFVLMCMELKSPACI